MVHYLCQVPCFVLGQTYEALKGFRKTNIINESANDLISRLEELKFLYLLLELQRDKVKTNCTDIKFNN